MNTVSISQNNQLDVLRFESRDPSGYIWVDFNNVFNFDADDGHFSANLYLPKDTPEYNFSGDSSTYPISLFNFPRNTNGQGLFLFLYEGNIWIEDALGSGVGSYINLKDNNLYGKQFRIFGSATSPIPKISINFLDDPEKNPPSIQGANVTSGAPNYDTQLKDSFDDKINPQSAMIGADPSFFPLYKSCYFQSWDISVYYNFGSANNFYKGYNKGNKDSGWADQVGSIDGSIKTLDTEIWEPTTDWVKQGGQPPKLTSGPFRTLFFTDRIKVITDDYTVWQIPSPAYIKFKFWFDSGTGGYVDQGLVFRFRDYDDINKHIELVLNSISLEGNKLYLQPGSFPMVFDINGMDNKILDCEIYWDGTNVTDSWLKIDGKIPNWYYASVELYSSVTQTGVGDINNNGIGMQNAAIWDMEFFMDTSSGWERYAYYPGNGKDEVEAWPNRWVRRTLGSTDVSIRLVDSNTKNSKYVLPDQRYKVETLLFDGSTRVNFISVFDNDDERWVKFNLWLDLSLYDNNNNVFWIEGESNAYGATLDGSSLYFSQNTDSFISYDIAGLDNMLLKCEFKTSDITFWKDAAEFKINGGVQTKNTNPNSISVGSYQNGFGGYYPSRYLKNAAIWDIEILDPSGAVAYKYLGYGNHDSNWKDLGENENNGNITGEPPYDTSKRIIFLK